MVARWVTADPFLIRTEDAEFALDPLRIRQGETATGRARFAEERNFEAVISRDGEEVLRTTELIEDLAPGSYEVSLSGVHNTIIPLTVIEPTSIEETVTHANPRLLKVMADRGDGEYFDEQEFNDLLSILKSKRAIVTTRDSTSIWQSYAWLLAIVLLVAAELFFRKRAGLL